MRLERRDLLLIALALASAAFYVLIPAARGVTGFPLDDAWIHQVYARNLATRGEFAFFPGQPSAGSTSPLWTIMLALGYLVHIDFRAWSYLLGALLIGASAIVAARLATRISGSSLFTVYCSLFTAFEWHLVWSAVSGMEIPLFVFLSLLLLERFYARERVWLIGLIAGLLTLTRPEGVVLAAVVGAAEVIQGADVEGRVRVPFSFALGSAILIVPYLLFNLAVSGTILPNTFYAKNAEYAVLFVQTPFFVRWLQLLIVPWIGAQILLLPGAIYIAIALAQKRDWRALIPFAWLLLLPALYAARLPVAYQYGRYEMPIIPFIALYGVWGTATLLSRIKYRVVRLTWVLSTAAALVAFWILGASAYGNDVAIIDCEMVQTARWVAGNAPTDAVIAAHDIGALGYFVQRPFIDLAGLVSPEVIPFMRDEGRLREYLFSRHATFAIFFPDWYPALAADSRFAMIHETECAATREAGGTNMAVYVIR